MYKQVKSNSQVNSSTGTKSKSKEKVSDKNIPINHLNHMLHNYKNDSYNYINMKEVESKSKHEQRKKSARSPANQHKKKGSYKLNAIYKQL